MGNKPHRSSVPRTFAPIFTSFGALTDPHEPRCLPLSACHRRARRVHLDPCPNISLSNSQPPPVTYSVRERTPSPKKTPNTLSIVLGGPSSTPNSPHVVRILTPLESLSISRTLYFSPLPSLSIFNRAFRHSVPPVSGSQARQHARM